VLLSHCIFYKKGCPWLSGFRTWAPLSIRLDILFLMVVLLVVIDRSSSRELILPETVISNQSQQNMSPLPQLAVRHDIAPTSLQDPIPTPRIYIQQDTVEPIHSTVGMKRGLPTATKVGFAMIPVTIVVFGLLALFLFWYQKRRAAQKPNLRSSISPPMRGKEIMSCNSSIASKRRSSKVYRMAAFSDPVTESRRCESPLFGPGGALEAAVQHNRNKMIQQKVIAAPTRSPARRPDMVETVPDSPIDGRSPFRLKRGDTVKRYSIGPELARLWPTPPASAWTRPSSRHAGPILPLAHRESSVYHERPARYI
jgi:hypothetical protein